MVYERSRRRSSPRRILLLLVLVGIGVLLIANQNELRQQVIPPPTPTATRTARSYVVEAESLAQTGNPGGGQCLHLPISLGQTMSKC
jgi:hypothetical protein